MAPGALLYLAGVGVARLARAGCLPRLQCALRWASLHWEERAHLRSRPPPPTPPPRKRPNPPQRACPCSPFSAPPQAADPKLAEIVVKAREAVEDVSDLGVAARYQKLAHIVARAMGGPIGSKLVAQAEWFAALNAVKQETQSVVVPIGERSL